MSFTVTSGTGGFLDIPPPVDKNKVLLIVDSSSALSVAAADYYQAARQLGPHRLSFNMSADKANGGSFTSGLGASATVLKTKYVDPVASYIQTHGIEAVITSADVPERCYLPLVSSGSNDQYQASFSFVLGNARWFSAAGFVEVSNALSLPTVVTSQQVVAGFYRSAAHIKPELASDTFPLSDGYDITSGVDRGVVLTYRRWPFKRGFRGESELEYSGGAMPFGRLGFGVHSSGRETLERIQQLVDTAVAAENKPWTDIKQQGLRFHIGLHYRYPQFAWSPSGPAYLYEMLTQEGFDTVYWTRSVPSDTPVYPYFQNPAYTYNTLITQGTANGGKAWAFLGLAFANDGPGLTWPTRFELQPGAWMMENTSFPHNPGVDLLMHGGVACFQTVQEPFTSGVVLNQYALRYLMGGATFMEASFHASGGFKYSHAVIGDPLYQPFAVDPSNVVLETNRRLLRVKASRVKAKA